MVYNGSALIHKRKGNQTNSMNWPLPGIKTINDNHLKSVEATFHVYLNILGEFYYFDPQMTITTGTQIEVKEPTTEKPMEETTS